MLFNHHTSNYSRQVGQSYNTLVISHDRQLFTQLSSFLKEFEPDRKPLLADDVDAFTAHENSLNQCDIMICDIRSKFAAAEIGTQAIKHAPTDILSIGLTSGQEYSQEILKLPQNLRLAGILNIQSGWRSNWHQISAIKAAWHNPLMVSRIEEVPVSDVLQMISSGR